MTRSSFDAIALLRSQSLAAVVQQEIERLILEGKFAPSEKLGEEEIAKRLNVGRGSVREAFRVLGRAGLVRVEKNRGVTVRQISPTEAHEIYELRAGLDKTIGQLAAARITDEQLEQLNSLIGSMEDMARAHDVTAYYPLNFQFHDLLASFTRNRTLLRTYRRVVTELHLFRRATLVLARDSFPISVREHAEVVAALSARDGERAGWLLYQHAMASEQRHAALSEQKGKA
jgi:phosphonate utilization transcriptional regulator